MIITMDQMRRFADFLSRMAAHGRTRPRTIAVLLCALAWVWTAWNGFPNLQNDDIQIEFLLLNGGAGGTASSIYTHAWLAELIRWGSSVCPGISWYFIAQLVLLLVSSYYVSLFVVSTLFSRIREGSFFSAVTVPIICLFIFFWLTRLFGSIQYTSTAIFAACAALTALFFFAGKRSVHHAIASLFLFWGALSLRFEAAVSVAAMGCGFAVLTALIGGRLALWRYLAGLSVLALAAAGNMLAQHAFFDRHAEWSEAASFLKARVALADYPDNSGIDKTDDYREIGLSTNDVAMFRSFIYAPVWDSEPLARRALAVHRVGNRGLFGSELAAKSGILSFDVRTLAKMGDSAVRLTPWVPLAYVLLAPLLFLRRLPTRRQLCILIPFLLILLAIAATGRPVARVYEPFLGFSTLTAAAFMPLRREGRSLKRISTGLLILCSLLCLLFVFRHYRHGASSPSHATADYCRSHPDIIYFSATLQDGSNLYHSSLFGSPGDAWRSGNIIPLADGWMFYTPAYRRFLDERGIDNPYASLCRENARLVTFIPHENKTFFQCVKTYFRERLHLDISFEEEASIPPCRFWRIHATPLSAQS